MLSRPTILFNGVTDQLANRLISTGLVNAVFVDDLLPFLSHAEWPELFTFDPPDDFSDLFQSALVLNRIFPNCATRFAQQFRDWGYHEQWSHAALSALLDNAAQLAHDPGIMGVSKSLLPLPNQWFLLRSQADLFSLPRYIYGFGGEHPDVTELEQSLQKSVWSLYDWKQENHLPAEEENWHRFYVSRPKGVPVICYFADIEQFGADGFGVLFPRHEIPVDESRLLHVSRVVSRTFGSLIGEFLVFVDGDRYEFCAFSPVMQTSIHEDRLIPMLNQWLDPRSTFH